MLVPSLDFGVGSVDSKLWFFNLVYKGRKLQDLHINLFMYYMRKMDKYGKLKKKITTTDDMFNQHLGLFYRSFLETPEEYRIKIFWNRDSLIFRYMMGLDLWCGKPLPSVEYVLMPVNTGDHWVLLRLDLKMQMLFVYDSIRSKEYDESMVKKLERYTVMLPYFLRFAAVWKFQKKTKGKAVEGEKIDLLNFVMVDDLPKQELPDCGAFVLAFAEYFMANRMDLCHAKFDIEDYRMRISTLLYHYGMMKVENNVESDDEEMIVQPPKSKKSSKK